MDAAKMSLTNLAGGKTAARFDDELAKVLENIADPNTEAKAVRVITLRVALKPDDERRHLDVIIAATSKMAPTKLVKTVARFGIGPNGPVAVEDAAQQLPLFPPEERDPNKVVDMPVRENGKE